MPSSFYNKAAKKQPFQSGQSMVQSKGN